MSVEITLNLPENLVEHAKQLSIATRRDLNAVLSDALTMLWPTVDGSLDLAGTPPIAELSDSQVLAIAASKMDEVQNQRLGHLQQKGKVAGLSDAERYELLALLQIYQLGQLRKSQALAEAVQRGLGPSLTP